MVLCNLLTVEKFLIYIVMSLAWNYGLYSEKSPRLTCASCYFSEGEWGLASDVSKRWEQN